jgi:anthranilate synthase/aminodeoxychorismate synthase-like glutamine amidotransferase
MILILDSYDSFVYNLARYLTELGREVQVRRSDTLTVDEVLAMVPAGIVLSPGPCTPREAGVGLELVGRLATLGAAAPPLLGVCLGHQVVAEAFGGRLRPARPPRHGIAVTLHRVGAPDPLLSGLPEPFTAGLYHSLAVDPEWLPPELEVSAVDEGGQIMALRHRTLPIHTTQFHPESILTPEGRRIMANFNDRTGGSG